VSFSGDITISREGQQFGPYTLEQVQQYLQSGNLVPTDLAWSGEGTTWVSLARVSGVQFAAPPRPLRRFLF
jgi:hypothetical protein